MNSKVFVASAMFLLSSMASAQQYSCKVYCNSGQTFVTLTASSAADAAAKVDKQGDQICKGDGKGNASSKTMSADQCSRK